MMSLRAIARAAPRVLARPSTLRPAAAVVRTSAAAAARPSFAATQKASAAFSTSAFRRAPAGEVDEELAAKLSSELEFETSVKEGETLPASIKDFLENGQFELKDVPGQQDVFLTRNFGNEKITVSFSIADLSSYQEQHFEDDEALTDEHDFEEEMGGRDSAKSGAADLEDAAEEDMDEADTDAMPCRLNIVVEKPNKGALNVEAIAQDGTIVVENVYFYKDAKLAHSSNPDAVHAAQDAYPGPAFGSLDEDLQILLERYLEERGVTPALALFVPDYMDMKEQKEYLAWLENVKGFIEA
ncbi:putative mitochondrial acidic protein MAM33 [Triangularia verruculosa]|uniref:Mitochondrial acidic protein MAM33 n=1 Tax=Triangularia verruculosa TaxID=2587418 RepID=A0AAN7AYW0_9PEZI|nr:putative mitochondrial acidic protein MAM33 [Triangularia verruculosa]